MDAYVRMTLYDPSTGNTEAFRTTTQVFAYAVCRLRPVDGHYLHTVV